MNTGAKDFEIRVLDDGDSIVEALKIVEQVNNQILTVEVSGSSDTETDDQGNRLCEWSMVVTYDPREG